MREPTEAGALIRDRLLAMGVTQSWLASALEVTEKHVSRVLVGDASFSPALAVKIEGATGLPADVLVTTQARAQLASARTDDKLPAVACAACGYVSGPLSATEAARVDTAHRQGLHEERPAAEGEQETRLPVTAHEADEQAWRVHDQLRAEAGIQRGRGGEERHMLAVRLDEFADRLTAARWRPVPPTADGGNVVDAITALAATVAGSPSTTAALILRYPGLAHGIDRVTRFADPPVDVYSFRPAHPCRRCGHDRADHHKLHCEADDGDCACPGGWVPVDAPSASGGPAGGGGS